MPPALMNFRVPSSVNRPPLSAMSQPSFYFLDGCCFFLDGYCFLLRAIGDSQGAATSVLHPRRCVTQRSLGFDEISRGRNCDPSKPLCLVGLGRTSGHPSQPGCASAASST